MKKVHKVDLDRQVVILMNMGHDKQQALMILKRRYG